MPRQQQYKPVILVRHNSDEQMKWGGCNDTRTDLILGRKYFMFVEVHSYHTQYYTDNKHYYNSVCFSDVRQPVR